MIRFPIRSFLISLAASGVLLAQPQPPSQPPSGGWRRAGDPPAAQAADPEPVDRSDAYGQPQQPPQPSQQPQQSMQQPMQQPGSMPPAAQSTRPAYGLPPQVTLKPGTFLTVRTNEPLSSSHNQPGDVFTASLAQPVIVDGIVIAQRGQTVYGRVAEVQKQHANNPSRLGLELTGLTIADGTQAPMHSQLVSQQGGTTPTGAQVGTVAGTTAVGAAVGAAADWGRGAAIGAGAGAAAGIVGVLLTRNHPTIVYPETVLTFRVDQPLTVSTVNAPQAFRFVGPEDYNTRPGQTGPVLRRPVPSLYTYGPYSYYPYYPYYWGPSVYYGWGGYWGFGGPRFYGGYRRFR
jgi:hypothetical protein